MRASDDFNTGSVIKDFIDLTGEDEGSLGLLDRGSRTRGRGNGADFHNGGGNGRAAGLSPLREDRRVPAEAVPLLGLAVVLARGVDDSPAFREVVQVATDTEVHYRALHGARGSGLERVDVAVSLDAARAGDGSAHERISVGVVANADLHDADRLTADLMEVLAVRPAHAEHFVQAFHGGAVVDVGETAGPDGAVLFFAAGTDAPLNAVSTERSSELIDDFVTHGYVGLM